MNILKKILNLFKNNKELSVVSLFDGIACGRVALERVGFKVKKYYAFEIDKYAIQIAQCNYPDIIQMGSVVGADFKQFRGKVDILIGGSPCQNLSICGDRTGLKGEKSKLFFEYVRALKEIKPKYFLLENNASMSDENKKTITQYMGVEPILINSALFSAQSRKRLYWTNINVDKNIKDKNISVENILDFSYRAENLINEVKFNNVNEKYDTKPIRIGIIGNGRQGERIYSIKAKTVNLTANGGGLGAKTGLYKINNVVRKLSPLEAERVQNLPDNYTLGIRNTQRYKCIGNGWTVDVIAHILKGIKDGKQCN